MPRSLLVLAAFAALAGCTRGRKVAAPSVSTVTVGSCADPARDGVIGEHPDLERADRDLDGDRRKETVVADKALCTREGNCYWNVFTSENSCRRYLGTVAASAIDQLDQTGEDGFADLRGWWRFPDRDRVLLQHYSFHRGGYRVVEAMTCAVEGDDRLLCAADEPR